MKVKENFKFTGYLRKQTFSVLALVHLAILEKCAFFSYLSPDFWQHLWKLPKEIN